MESHYTDPELADLVVYYLRNRGRQKFGQLAIRVMQDSTKSLPRCQIELGGGTSQRGSW